MREFEREMEGKGLGNLQSRSNALGNEAGNQNRALNSEKELASVIW